MPAAARIDADPAAIPLSALKGVGPRVAERLARGGLHSVQDLWFHLPLRYEDRTRITPIADLQAGVPAQIEGAVTAVERSFRFRPQLKVALSDAAGASATLRFFHFNANQIKQFVVGRRIRAYGEPRGSLFGVEIIHPSYRALGDDQDAAVSEQLDPIYPMVEGVGSAVLARLITQALEHLPADADLELLPTALLRRFALPALRPSLLAVHRPGPDADLAALSEGAHPAQQRLALEELLAHHLSLRQQRARVQQHGAVPVEAEGVLVERLRERLPFRLTGAQLRVFAEVRGDMARAAPMLRLVQGDVGSGKTVVAALAALLAIENGRQVALMAPTELLAEQHLNNLRGWLEPLGVRVGWLAGKVAGKARAQLLEQLAAGDIDLAVGTHALMQQGVEFRDLALAVIDEQHRFGVHQRLALRDKGRDGRRVPHQLVMTATPIPRTLAMTAYADLDVSAIDELPPGRTPIQTVVVSNERRGEVVERIAAACAEGRQAYWVCTLIDDSDEVQAQAAQTSFEQLGAQLPQLRVGLVHGRLKPKEKQAAMLAFKTGELDLLVATTVIEVGVDVPNASLMLIENAERLGLAQLHQLRGRVGRGAAASSCVLLYQSPLSQLARERLQIMRQTNDGFVIAEKDLELRGPGELLGTRQTGLAQFRVADLARDAHLLPQVHEAADALLASDPLRAERLVRRWIGQASQYAGV